jgi:hypothetical protein
MSLFYVSSALFDFITPAEGFALCKKEPRAIDIKTTRGKDKDASVKTKNPLRPATVNRELA